MAEQVQLHILKKYDIIKKLGSGAYGHVWKVQNRKTKQIYALKKIFDAFQHATDAQRTYREIVFLHQFNHQNLIKLIEVIKAQNDKDIYLVFQFMQIDLHHVIRQDILKQKHKQYIVYQIAKSIKYLHSAQLIHRDLKPSNVLINSQCLVKLCDFGLVRSIFDNSGQISNVMTEYIATRWYRAPQIILGSHNYSKAVDIWSFGCLICQLIKGKPMFAGSSTINQLERVLTWTGYPSIADIQSLQSDIASSTIQNLRGIKTRNKEDWFPNADQLVIDLITKMLQFNPNKRLRIQQVLSHPYLNIFHNESKELICDHIIKAPIDDNKKLNVKQYRQLIYKQISLKYGQRIKQQSNRFENKFDVKYKKKLVKSLTKQNPPSSQIPYLAKTLYVYSKKPNQSISKGNVKGEYRQYRKLSKQKYLTEIEGTPDTKSINKKYQNAYCSKKSSIKWNENEQKDFNRGNDEQKRLKTMVSVYANNKKTQLLAKYLQNKRI